MLFSTRSRTACVVAAALFLAGGAGAAKAAETQAARGVLRALNEAAISSDMATRVVALPYREGEAFAKGATLVEFDCERMHGELKAAEAEQRGQLAAWRNSARLSQLGAAGANEVELAAAGHDKAAGVVEGLKARVKGCAIVAPFAGRVLDLNVRRYETPAVNQPIIRIVDDSAVEIDMLLPASAIASLKTGDRFRLVLDDTGRVIDGEVTRVGPALDIVSQTFKASGAPKGDLVGVLPGMSGTIILEKQTM
jgi:multidrug resistance efflux pump